MPDHFIFFTAVFSADKTIRFPLLLVVAFSFLESVCLLMRRPKGMYLSVTVPEAGGRPDKLALAILMVGVLVILDHAVACVVFDRLEAVVDWSTESSLMRWKWRGPRGRFSW